MTQSNTEFSIAYNPSISSINLVSTELEKGGVTLICNPEFFSGNHWDVVFEKEIVAELIFNFYLNSYRFISNKKDGILPKVIENFLSQMNSNVTDEPWRNSQAKKAETQSITQDQLNTYWFAWRNINTDTPFISFVALLYPLTKLDTLEVIRYELKKSKTNS